MNKTICAVVVAFNRGDKIKLTLDSLRLQTRPPDKIILVDNSTDPDKRVTLKSTPKMQVLFFGRNLGPDWARNVGYLFGRGYGYLLFVDDDVILSPGTVERLLYTFTDNLDCVGAMPVVYFWKDKKRIWSAGSMVDLLTGQTRFFTEKPAAKYSAIPAAVSVLMTKPEYIRKAGWYDPVYFFSYEDADFYYRLRQENRGNIYVQSETKTYHDIPVADEKAYFRLALRSYYIARNRVIFLKRYGINFTANMLFIALFSLYYFYLGVKLGFPLSGLRFWEGVVDGLRVVRRLGNKVSPEAHIRTNLNVEKIDRVMFLKNYPITLW